MRLHLRDFRRDVRGNVAIALALAAVPVLGGMGVAVDYARANRVQAELQNVVDSAALAGAMQISNGAVTSTVSRFLRNNRDLERHQYNIHHDVDVEAHTITVEATATVPTTIGAIFRPVIPVAVSATAYRGTPVRTVDLQVTEFNSDAWDANSIYWYIVPEDGSAPKDEDLHLLLSNDPRHPAPEVPDTIQIGVNDVLGFALINVTGGVKPYGKNSYGQPAGSVHKFYSHMEPENLRSAGHSDCSSGSVQHSWDDNGGGSDDNDYNDGVYEFSCATVRTDPTTVYLLR